MDKQTNPRPVGRPPGPDSTVLSLRIPVALLARLDRAVDREEQRRGAIVNRAVILREALQVWLEAEGL
jgi:hypothetical protein